MIITLCGSTKFKGTYEDVEKDLALMGHIIITPNCWGRVDKDPEIDKAKTMLDKIHCKKIDLSDAIYIIDVNGYIGDSTKSEIAYAKLTGKDIYYLSKGGIHGMD
jgi:hypothetical protein